jgi:hypothetical protein
MTFYCVSRELNVCELNVCEPPLAERSEHFGQFKDQVRLWGVNMGHLRNHGRVQYLYKKSCGIIYRTLL